MISLFLSLAFAAPCTEFLEGTKYLAQTLPRSLIGKRIAVRFHNWDRYRWNEDRRYTFRDLEVVTGIDMATGTKRRGLVPKVGLVPPIEGVLVGLEGRSFKIAWRQRQGQLRTVTFAEGAEFSVFTDARGEAQVRDLDSRDSICFVVRPELPEDRELQRLFATALSQPSVTIDPE